jgi:V8-like Glu-specific endopeptidase
MKKIILPFIFFFNTMVFGQGKSILVFDLIDGTIDSITNITYDKTILSENTIYNKGCFNKNIEKLNNTSPESNLYPGSQFTQKKRASSDFDLTNFPIRTSVKIFQTNNNYKQHLCSGSLISKRHVITAAHCVSNLNTNQLIFDSIYVSPVFDNGKFNANFNGSYVTKVYFLRNWSLTGEDIAILELDEPIGELTGWISIGFNKIDTSLKKGVFYKFSYPTATNLIIDSNEYNGDTLYYNYGVLDNLTEHRISITNATGIGGESGSSIIEIENGEKYITYGVLSLASNLSHSRINNWRYYAIKSIIGDDLIIENKDLSKKFIVYPNPANNVVHLRSIKNVEVLELILFDNTGRKCVVQNNFKCSTDIDISSLPNGIYFLSITTNDSITIKKIIKTGAKN